MGPAVALVSFVAVLVAVGIVLDRRVGRRRGRRAWGARSDGPVYADPAAVAYGADAFHRHPEHGAGSHAEIDSGNGGDWGGGDASAGDCGAGDSGGGDGGSGGGSGD